MKLSAPVTGGPCWAEAGTTGLESAKRFRTRLFGWRPEKDQRRQPGGHTVAYTSVTPRWPPWRRCTRSPSRSPGTCRSR